MRSVLQRVEQHPVLTVFVLALGARLLAVGVLHVWLDGLIFPDVQLYATLADLAVDGPPGEWGRFSQRKLYADNRAFLWPLAFLHRIAGSSLFVGGIYAAALGALAAGATARLTLEVVEARWAILAGMVMAFLPSMVLWSSMGLKESTVWVLLVLLALCVAAGSRATGRALFAWYTAVAGLLVGIAYIRQHTFMVAVIALAVASLASRGHWRWQRVATAVLLALVVPWSVGMGPAGIDFLTTGRSAQEWRVNLAEGADTAVVDISQEQRAASGSQRHTIVAELTYLPRGLAVMLLYPPPWSAPDNPRVQIARLEQLVWLPVLLLALLGLLGARRRLDVLLFPILAGGGILVVYALASGNFGTAYRHRAEFVWAVALLAGMGARRLLRGSALPAEAAPDTVPDHERD